MSAKPGSARNLLSAVPVQHRGRGGAGHSHAGPATGGEKVNVKIWVQIEYLDIFM